ncbi:MAG TPA: non-canonical purine NTP pyrophosphatase [Pilimelia sp.]|nr:non-canonical purine NTP pyrophosphatase [Pilimelia sp.]
MTRLLLASRNAKKLAELRRILDAALAGGAPGITLVGLGEVPEYPEAPETGLTFAENALLKAREGVRHTGLPTVADDSGLSVDALGGMPGVFSARWCGRHGDDDANLDLVLGQLRDVPDAHRGAAFVCAAALVLPGGGEWVVEGRQRGRLLRARRGDGGFGYDPVFLGDGQSATNAELSPAEKDAVSHRGAAFRELAGIVARELSGPR